MKIITVPGIKSKGQGSTDLIGQAMRERGFEVHDMEQAVRSAWGARWKAQRDAKDIIEVAKDGDVVIAHSYGCLKTSIAMRGPKLRAVFLFRPAMSRWHRFPMYQGTKIHCIYSKQDWAIFAGSLALYHPFGLAGFSGFRSPYVNNVESKGAHSDDFKDKNIAKWADFVTEKLRF